MSVYPFPHMMAGNDVGAKIGFACRFDDNRTTYLTRTPGTAGNRRKFTVSAWLKPGDIAATTHTFFQAGTSIPGDSGFFAIEFTGAWDLNMTTGGTQLRQSRPIFKDPSAWLHVLATGDTTLTTDQFCFWINGVQIDSWHVNNNLPQNTDLAVNNTVEHRIGNRVTAGPSPFDGYMADYYFIDGDVVDVNEFGRYSTTNPTVWVPRTFGGSYGTNGFHLDFADDANLGNDVSGGNNDWTASGLLVSDQRTDTPSINRCVFNNVEPAPNISLSNGNLVVSSSATGGAVGTHSMRDGLFEWQVRMDTINGNSAHTGVIDESVSYQVKQGSATSNGRILYKDNGDIIIDAAVVTTVAAYVAGDVITTRLDATQSPPQVEFLKNNVTQGSYSLTSVTGVFLPWVLTGGSGATGMTLLAEPKDFAHPLGAGYRALSTTSLSVPAIPRPDRGAMVEVATGFDIELQIAQARDGWGSAYLDIFKDRDAAGRWQWRFGADASNMHTTGDAGALLTGHGYTSLVAVTGSNSYFGMTIRLDRQYGTYHEAVVHGGVSDTTVTDNTGTTEKAIFLFTRIADSPIWMYHPRLTAGSLLQLNSSAAETVSANIKNVTANSFDIDAGWLASTIDVLVIATKTGGVSVVGYTGNGSADGPVSYFGFRPLMTLNKRATGAAADWQLNDAKRSPFNGVNQNIQPNANAAESNDGTAALFNFLATGRKVTNAGHAVVGAQYVTVAFGETPFGGGQGAVAVIPPANAR